MQYFLDYLVSNIPLFCLSFVVIFLAVRNFKFRRKESIYFIVFTALVIYLSVAVYLERLEASFGHVVSATFFTTSGYIVRPILLFIFCLLANADKKRSYVFYLAWISPIIINLAVYLLPLFFNTSVANVVFYYELQADGSAKFMRGGIINFFAHVVSLAYLLLLVYVSTMRFYGKHRRDAMVLSLCVIFISATVIAEVVTGRNDLLNVVCEICAIINYIFITSVNTSKDALTNLYDRKTFYEDSTRYKDKINGIIQMDMNGLKHLNDSLGHQAGDNALFEVSNIFDNCLYKETMFAYRLSGDEFIILMIQGKEEELLTVVKRIKERMESSIYSIAIGYCYIEKNSKIDFREAMIISEKMMYEDKNKYYLDNKIERRRE